ncbi:fimbria/pilus outer membrane usher protein [Vibrio natriegens]|uniref:fimbria/pilus outer membrane usher protein n=1 Tax=Vibrio natriegens TaxID=691 RepID=UPI00355632E9
MFKMTKVALAVAILCSPLIANAADGDFNLNALELDEGSTLPQDLEAFVNSTDGMLPGHYKVDVYFNNHYMALSDIEFISIKGKDGLRPLISKTTLATYGVKMDEIPATKKLLEDEAVAEWENYIPNFIYKFDAKKQRLDLFAPQIYVERTQQGWVNPETWDDGVPAFLLNYSLQGINSWTDGESVSNNYYGNFRSGFNIGAWRVRNYSTYSYDADTDVDNWDNLGTKVFRDIKSIRSRFEAGNISTRSNIFDSVKLLGAQVTSEDSMLPSSQQGFAPVIHGIANSNAKVTVEQDGSIIYQTVVSPGQFVIDDLYPTSLSGDLLVTVTEEDGSERTFIQPFSGVPNMVREGQFKYTLSAGEYDSSSIDADDFVGELSAMYGLSNRLTVYGGLQFSEDYDAFALGLGVSLGQFGALTADVTHSIAQLDNQGYTQGQSYSLNYSKDIEELGASFTLASYRYSTADFYSLEDLLAENSGRVIFGYEDHKKERLQVSFNQQIKDGDWGSLSVYGYQQEYWDTTNTDRNLSVSYNNNIGRVSYSLSYSMMDSDRYSDDRQFMVNASIPLDGWSDSGYVDFSLTEDNNHHTTGRVAYSDSALEDDNLNYNIAATVQDGDDNNAASASVNYTGSQAELNATVSKRRGGTQLSYGASGAIIAHSGGVTLSQSVNSAEYNGIVIVDTNEAEDVHVNNGTGIETDGSGHAVIPYVNSYRENEVSIDTNSLSGSMEATNAVQKVSPTAGAVVKANFNVRTGYKALLTLRHNGQSVPFGSVVKVADDISNEAAYVGDNGVVYLSGLNDKGELQVQWGNKTCTANYDLTQHADEANIESGIVNQTIDCR